MNHDQFSDTKTNNKKHMKVNAGLWIDHREAIIVVLSETGEETKHIQSTAEKQLRRSGEHSTGSFEAQNVPADDSRERAYSGHLADYYDQIVFDLRDAGSILIIGPGEAKGELKKRFESEKSGTHTLTMETADKMTEPQIVAKVRHHFHQDVARHVAGGGHRHPVNHLDDRRCSEGRSQRTQTFLRGLR